MTCIAIEPGTPLCRRLSSCEFRRCARLLAVLLACKAAFGSWICVQPTVIDGYSAVDTLTVKRARNALLCCCDITHFADVAHDLSLSDIAQQDGSRHVARIARIAYEIGIAFVTFASEGAADFIDQAHFARADPLRELRDLIFGQSIHKNILSRFAG